MDRSHIFDNWIIAMAEDDGEDFCPLLLLIGAQGEPELLGHLSKVRSLSLDLLFHRLERNRSLGVRAVSHLMQTLPVQELVSTGTAYEMIEALKRCLENEKLVLEVLPVLILALKRMGADPASETANEILLKIIRRLDLANAATSIRNYWQSLRLVIEFIGTSVVREGNRILHRMLGHLAHPLSENSEEMFHELLVTCDYFVRVTRGQLIKQDVVNAVILFCYNNNNALRRNDRVRADVLTLIHTMSQVHPLFLPVAKEYMKDPMGKMRFFYQELESYSQTAQHQP